MIGGKPAIPAAAALFALALSLPSLGASVEDQAATTRPAATVVVALHGTIDDFSRDSLFRRFDEARGLGAKTIILDLNTYGGMVTAGLDISRFLKRQDDLHTIAFVDDKAISAGAMVALACNEIIMEPGAVIGDAAPISVQSDGGLQSMGAAERAKAESPVLADFRDSAVRRGYDPLLVESMVSVGRTVHWVEDAQGNRRFVDADEYTRLTTKDGWKPVPGFPNPIDAADTLFTAHSDEAVKLGLAKGTASSVDALATERGLSIRATLTPGIGDKFVELLGGSLARMIILIVFLQSLYLALHTPGHGAPEAVAVLSLALLLGIPLLTGYAQWWEIVMIFAGLGLLAFEIFVFPGHFVSGAIGALMVMGGLIMTFVPRQPGSTFPNLSTMWPAVERGVLVVAGGLVCSVLLSLWLSRYLPKLPMFNRLILTATSGAKDVDDPDAAIRRWRPPPGSIGRALTDLRPSGTAEFVADASKVPLEFDVVSGSGHITAGSQVVVHQIQDGRITVRSVT